MPTNVTWDGVTYPIPSAGEVNWPSLSAFLIALGDKAAIAQEMKQAVRVATTTPVTVSDTTDCVVATNLSVAGAVAVTLPAGTDGRWFAIADQRGDAATNNVTITPNGSETINGSATYVISENRGGVILVYSATNTRWNVVGRYIPGAVLTNPMDSAGDMIYGGGSGVATKLDAGSSGQVLVSGGAGAPAWGTQHLGTATNDNAAAGYVGQFASNNPSGAVAMAASDTFTAITNVSLTAGDWDVEGTAALSSGTMTGTRASAAISTSSTDVDAANLGGIIQIPATISTGSTGHYPTGVRRISLSGTTTIYLIARCTYSVVGTSEWLSSSFIRARRVR